ncbi:MAG: glycoside hydrolase family 2 TIM barrel-domain containing protein, partial [Planctomycetota bacterium]
MIRPLLLSLCLLCFCLVSIRAEVMDLAGDWQARPLNGSWPPVSLPDDGKDAVQTVLVPNAGWSHPEHAVDEEMLLAAGGVVISRTIIVSPEASARTPVLRWESLLWSHRVFVDGELVGGRDHYAPGQLNLPRLGAGEHRLSIVLANLSSLPRGEAGHYLLPVGSGDKSWGRKKSSVGGALDLRFVDGERIDAVLMMPDLVHERVRVRLDSSLLGQEAGADQRQVAIRITDPDGAIVVDARHAHSGIGSRVIFTHPIPDPKPWHPDSPQCYRVSVSISDADGLRDRYESTFGMRTFQVVDGDFQLNGAYHPILGTNVVVDWLKGPDWFHDRDGKLTDFYIDRAQGMNAGTLRTHTLPPNHRVAAICDAGGTMLLAEMPLTYNGADYDCTEAEEQQYRDAAEEMQAAWVQGLGNHPSIIMWVPINEPTMGNVRGLRDWQEQRLEPALRELDPTREVLQAADLSQTIADVHNHSGFWDGAEGDFHERLRIHARNAGLDGVQRALFNSEYIEGMWGKRRYRWAGPDEDFASYWRIYSHIGHEQTDAMRVLGYDGILPYWMAAWTWTPKEGAHRDWAPTMMYAAQKSSLARATAVVDLFDRNHEPRSLLGVPVVLVNDHATARQLHCELHLVSENPGFDPDWDGFTAETRIASISRSMASGERHTWLVPVELPATGNHYLAAVTRVDDEAVAVSQRIIRITAPQVPTGLRERSITVLGADAAVIAGLQDLGLDVRSGLGSGMPTSDLILVWSDAGLDPHSAVFRSWANAWLSDGGRMLFLAQKHWDDGGFAHLPTD